MKKRSERILRSERGFTLVELGVVLAIMAILAMAAYPTYKNIRDRAYEAEAWAIMQEIRVEVWSYYLENDYWPAKFPAEDEGKSEYDTEHWKFSGVGQDKTFKITAKGRTTLILTLDTDGKATKGD